MKDIFSKIEQKLIDLFNYLGDENNKIPDEEAFNLQKRLDEVIEDFWNLIDETEELLDLLFELLVQCCYDDKKDVFYSMCVSTYAEAIKLLHNFGYLKIIQKTSSRCIVAKLNDINEKIKIKRGDVNDK